MRKFILGIFALMLLVGTVAAVPAVTYCCEKTTYGAWCQNDKLENCMPAPFQKTPTSCDSTAYCTLGCCYDSDEGLCMENTPQQVCMNNKGVWAENPECNIPQCNLGCCVLGQQASFATLARCKKLSSFYGLETDFRLNINNELECLTIASLADEGACVYQLDYGKNTCKYASRQECTTIKQGMKFGNGTVTSNVTFYKDLLCSNSDLATNCAKTKKTGCIEGKEEVYFIDSCGNPANIYDSSKVGDEAYWRKKVSKAASCNAADAEGNSNSQTCGNCNYFSGSICKLAKTSNPKFGDYMCKDLDCATTTDGAKKHGESWCSTDDQIDSVGSRYFRHLCIDGEEILEPCADFRQEICIQDKISARGVSFSQAACRVNRWQDCLGQLEKRDCENIDKRDCKWVGSADEVGNGTLACFPLDSPGLKFWEEGDAKGTCAAANTQCTVVFEKKMIGGEKCVDNCECLEQSWIDSNLVKCEAIGDCGAKVSWIGQKGYDLGYKVKKS